MSLVCSDACIMCIMCYLAQVHTMKDVLISVCLSGVPVCVQLAPENTMMSFVRSVACNVSAFETDVQIRYPVLGWDGVGWVESGFNTTSQ